MNRLVRSVSIANLLLVLGFFFIAAYMNHGSEMSLQRGRDLVEKATDVMLQLELIISKLKDCETGQRGYIITGDQSYLEPYEKWHATVSALIDKLESLNDENTQEPGQIQKLRELTDKELAALSSTIQFRREQGFEPTQKLLIATNDKARMDEIRSLVNEMQIKQRILLHRRLDRVSIELNSRRVYSKLFTVTGCLLLFGLGISSLALVAKKDKELTLKNTQYDITQTLADSPDVNDSITLVLAMICENLNWDFATFWTVDNSLGGLKCVNLWQVGGFEASEFLEITSSTILPEGNGLPGKTFERQIPIWVDDMLALPSRGHPAYDGPMHTALGVPITLSNKRIGVIEFFSRKRRKRDEDIIRLTVALGHQIAQSVEREQAQKTLIEREATLSTILDTAADGIFSVSRDGGIEAANAAAAIMFGCDWKALIHKNVSIFLPKFLEITGGWSNESSHTGTEFFQQTGIETLGVRVDGSDFPAEISFSASKLRGKEIATVVVRDITERKAVQRRVSEFYSAVSHELRTPLTSISGSLSLMDGGRAGEMSPRAQQLIKVARSESDRLIRLINDILDIKKIESGKLELKFENVQMAELCADLAEALSGFAQQVGITLSFKFATGTIYCDKDRIKQILYNLLSNAIKFSPSGETVTVEACQTENDRWRISVEDHGPGIAKSDMDKLFGLFQQLDPSDSRRKGGTGLGLAICKALVAEHHGSIGIESKVGKGSTFWFELPNKQGNEVSQEKDNRPTLMYRNESQILIVEKECKLANLLTSMLEEQNGIAIKSSSIKEAEEYLKDELPPDAMILDFGSSEAEGHAFLSKLEQLNTKSIPLIIVSDNERDKEGCTYPLVVDWIKKPCDEKRLLSALALAIKKRPVGKAKILIAEDDQTVREVIKQSLEPLNVEFIEASDGVTAVHLARSQNPDLIVLDLELPAITGFEVVQILRKEKIRDVPLLVYTNTELSENDKKELTLGVTLHLIKSRTSEEKLLETVKNMLNGFLDHNRTPV